LPEADVESSTGEPAPENPSPGATLDAPAAYVVPPDAAGMRLDVFLTQAVGVDSRRRVKAIGRAGGLLLDGKPAKPGWTVQAGQRVMVLPVKVAEDEEEEREPPPPLFDPRILYEDGLLLVIDKPPGIAAHRTEKPRPGETNLADVMERLRPGLSLAGGEDRPGIVHRLDKETSGLMVLARTDAALLALKAQFKARSVEKEYRAIVYGEPRFDSDWIDRPIQPHPEKHDRMVVVKEGGREASTFYEVIERFRGMTYVRCLPKTGRTHQIRVHMASIGHSLVGDRLYRSRNQQQAELPAGAPDPQRHCLHALRLCFEHPHTHERLCFESPLPKDLSDLLAWLRAQGGGAGS
jgi:23S rRNA pseudouridine1911/1915/1917 synthase